MSSSEREKLDDDDVFSELVYGMESWTLKKNVNDRLEALEMWSCRRI